MPRIALIIIASIIVSFNCLAQQNPSDKELLDSLLKHDHFMKMLDSFHVSKSYLKINIGVGNRLFSVHNNSLNALQTSSEIIFTPSLGYYHKSGFGISAAAYLLNNNNKTDFYQYSVTPSYDYQSSQVIATGISYTRFIKKDEYGGATSPVQNDFYGYAYLKKPWIRPGVAFGYSSGEYKEIQTVKFTLPVLGERTFVDTAITKLKSFSFIGTVEHTFDFFSVLSDKDGLSVTPTLLLNAATSKYTITHKNKYFARVKNRKARVKRKQSVTSSFEVESLGLSLDLNYNIGRFYFNPQVYLDYYLPKTEFTKFTQVFTVNIGLQL